MFPFPEEEMVRALRLFGKKRKILLCFHGPKLRSLTPALSQRERKPPHCKSFRIRDCVIPFFVTREKSGEATGRSQLHFNLVPLPVIGEIRRIVTNRIL